MSGDKLRRFRQLAVRHERDACGAGPHTTWCAAAAAGPTVRFHPRSLVAPADGDEPATAVVFAQAVHVLRELERVERVRVEVDASDMDAAAARRILRAHGVAAARDGVQLFACLPCRVAAIVVDPPPRNAAGWWWPMALRLARAQLGRKLASRVVVRNAQTHT
jgi:hypothetical protein